MIKKFIYSLSFFFKYGVIFHTGFPSSKDMFSDRVREEKLGTSQDVGQRYECWHQYQNAYRSASDQLCDQVRARGHHQFIIWTRHRKSQLERHHTVRRGNNIVWDLESFKFVIFSFSMHQHTFLSFDKYYRKTREVSVLTNSRWVGLCVGIFAEVERTVFLDPFLLNLIRKTMD